MKLNCLVGLAFLFICHNALLAQDEEEITDESTSEISMTIGSPAPPIDVEHWVSNGNGKFDKVTKFEDGKVYVVEFWATWCGPCIGGMPHLVEIQTKYADRGVQIIGVTDEDMETVNEFLDGEYQSEDGETTSTYRELTNAYCLTADPDRSVENDYFRAAGQSGIPCCFIVGKTQHIEWIGHPMEMDEPLEKVVSDSWDRDAYLVEFKKSQRRDELMEKIFVKMRRGDSEGALELLAEVRAEAEGDETTLALLERIEFQVKATPALQKLQSGDIEDGMEMVNDLAKTVGPDHKNQLYSIALRLLLGHEEHDKAAEVLENLVSVENPDSELLNEVTWNIYEMAADDEEFSRELIDAATSAAEVAVKGDPENGMILDTLAHLLHRQGKLDEALEIQTRAMKNPGAAEAEIKAFLEQLKAEKAGG